MNQSRSTLSVGCRGLLAALVLAWPVLAGAASSDVVGYVLSLDGQWLMRGSDRALVVGAALPADAELVARSAAAGDRIVVVAARSGAVLLSHQCTSAEACRQPIRLQAASDGGTRAVLGELMRAVMARLEGEPDRYVATLTRGPARLGDAVLAWQDGAVNLAPVLQQVAAGDWLVGLNRLDCAGRPQCTESLGPAVLAWRPGSPALVPVAGGEPGLYELTLRRRPAGERPELIRRAWVLVAGPSEHAAKAEQFAAALRLTEGWGDAVEPGPRQGFLRALLDEMSRR
jgi:hypothetical protein